MIFRGYQPRHQQSQLPTAMDNKAPIQAKENSAQSNVLGTSGFDNASSGMSYAPQPFQLTAANEAPLQLTPDTNAPLQLQRHDPTKFPWKGTVTGAAKIIMYSGAEVKDGTTVGEIAKGVEVEVKGKSGEFYKVKGKTVGNETKEGYVKAANISGTISELNTTVAAMDETMNDMYKDSFNDDKTVVHEHGTAIVEKDGVIKNKDIATGGSGSVGIDRSVSDGETFIGDVHTHPYSKDEGLEEGVAFSAGDISNMREANTCFQGYQKFVEAGTKRFALVITDEAKAKKFFDDNSKADITSAWNTAFSASKGDFQQSVIDAVWAVIGKDGVNGISFYGTTDEKKLQFDHM